MADLSPRRLAPWAALALGAWLVLNGIGHTAGSIRVSVAEARPYDFRYASLMTLGLTLAFAGLVQMALLKPLRTGARWAFALSGGTALFVVALVLLLVPVFPAVGMLALHLGHLALLALAWRARAPA